MLIDRDVIISVKIMECRFHTPLKKLGEYVVKVYSQQAARRTSKEMKPSFTGNPKSTLSQV